METAPVQPAPEATVKTDARVATAPAPSGVKLGEGERLWNETGESDNVAGFAPAAAKQPVRLYVVRTGDHKGVLRADHDGRTRDVETFTLAPGGKADVRVRRLSDERALLTFTPWADGGEKNPRVGLLLGWDDEEGRVRVLKRWRGGLEQKEPAWFTSGQPGLDDDALASCQRVVKRMSACANDGGFREALFRRSDAAERKGVERDFTGQARRWGKADSAREQCRSWASTDYEDSHLSDTGELDALVKDTQLSCEMFGRELDDEGGLPRRRVRDHQAN